MEHTPEPKPLSHEEILNRISAIGKRIIELEQTLPGVSAKFEDSNSVDDNGTEAAESNQELGTIAGQIERLRHEMGELEAQLHETTK